jgi:hypothetical protein
MLTILEQIHQKLPQASETLLQEVLTILSAATPQKTQQLATDVFNTEDSDLANEFAQWETASDEDSQWIEEMLTQEQI